MLKSTVALLVLVCTYGFYFIIVFTCVVFTETYV